MASITMKDFLEAQAVFRDQAVESIKEKIKQIDTLVGEVLELQASFNIPATKEITAICLYKAHQAQPDPEAPVGEETPANVS